MAAKNKIFFSSIFLLALLALAFNGEKWAKPYFYLPTKSNAKSGISIPHSSELYQEVVHDLVVPWDIAFLEGDLLVTERGGFLQRVGKKRETLPIVDTHQSSEGGLLGITLHPNFEENRWLYLYNSIERQGEIFNQIERYEYKEGKLLNKTIILEGIPGAKYHDGGRMAFGPDGFLYVTTGDADREELAQDLRSLAGKILRLRDDGKFPSDNPFGNAIYSYGHRNSQGLTWDNLGRLWSTEHGPSGDDAGFDELNLIEKGANYVGLLLEEERLGRE